MQNRRRAGAKRGPVAHAAGDECSKMLLAEMRLGASAPGADKVVIQSRANRRTGNRNHPSRPLLDDFGAGLRGDALNHFRHKPIDHFFFQQFAADVHSGGAGGGNPELRGFVVGVVFETVEQAQFLNGAQSDAGKNARSGTMVRIPPRPNPAPSAAATFMPLRMTRFATSSRTLISTE